MQNGQILHPKSPKTKKKKEKNPNLDINMREIVAIADR